MSTKKIAIFQLSFLENSPAKPSFSLIFLHIVVNFPAATRGGVPGPPSTRFFSYVNGLYLARTPVML